MRPLEEDMLPHSPRPLHPVTWAKDGHSSKSGPLPTPAPACQVVGEQQAVKRPKTEPRATQYGAAYGTPMQEGGLRSHPDAGGRTQVIGWRRQRASP